MSLQTILSTKYESWSNSIAPNPGETYLHALRRSLIELHDSSEEERNILALTSRFEEIFEFIDQFRPNMARAMFEERYSLVLRLAAYKQSLKNRKTNKEHERK